MLIDIERSCYVMSSEHTGEYRSQNTTYTMNAKSIESVIILKFSFTTATIKKQTMVELHMSGFEPILSIHDLLIATQFIYKHLFIFI